ncbi:MAG TPA: copper resistance protein NlpE [Sphingobacterium sp.]|nr:copper resistance protein NlpE [Sphingobacterium sp.]
MKKTGIAIVLFSILVLSACNSNTRSQNEENKTRSEYIDTTHTSQNSLDWGGTYEGTVPCADCPGIKTTVTLGYDGTFTYAAEYLERDVMSTDSGTFMWHSHGNIVHLQGQGIDLKFQVGENQLFQLDQQGERISGELAEHFILKKVQ